LLKLKAKVLTGFNEPQPKLLWNEKRPRRNTSPTPVVPPSAAAPSRLSSLSGITEPFLYDGAVDHRQVFRHAARMVAAEAGVCLCVCVRESQAVGGNKQR
jgi:hypothetical protein